MFDTSVVSRYTKACAHLVMRLERNAQYVYVHVTCNKRFLQFLDNVERTVPIQGNIFRLYTQVL